MKTSKELPPVTGVYAALVTPRQPHSIEADAASLFDYLDFVVAAGVDGLVLFGSTGEFIHFDVAERMRVLMLAIKRSRVPLLVNISHSTLVGAVDLAQDAIAVGAAGLLLMPPYFYRYSEEQIYEFYRQFVKMAEPTIPVYLYNLPFSTNPISAELAKRLFATGSFAGIKDSSGDWLLFEALNKLRPKLPFKLLAGNETIYLRARLAGANGIISGIAASLPELIVALDRAIEAQDLDRAHLLNKRLDEFLSYLSRFPATVAIKQAAAARGWKINHFAVPFDEDTAAEVIAFHQWFRAWWPSVLAESTQVATTRG
jgi:dihydrodipicolinate synthase/N-acetylneuraminate lyase